VPADEQKRVTVFLAELVGAPFPDADDAALQAARQDARLMSEQMRDAWLAFLRAETARRPVLLLLEDLHWGDFGTVRFIDVALRECRDLPWMVLALARPELHATFPGLWAERSHVQEIGLKALGRKACERLVRQVLGDRVEPETTERLVTQAAGNAFYLEELIRAAAEGKDGALPQTVIAMVETRLGQLPPPARQVLRAASVFGDVSWEGGLAALLGGARGAAMVAAWIERLIEQEVLTVQPESRFPGEREVAFRHALLREGAYAALPEAERRRAHLLAGEWLAEHGEGNPMLLAGHFERGGDTPRAAGYYLRAAEQAFHVRDLETTISRAGLGLACAPPPELRHALLGIRCAAAGSAMWRLPEIQPDAEELLRSALPGSIPWAQAMFASCNFLMMTGRIDELLATIQVLRTVTPAPDAVDRMAFTLVVAICILDFLGQIAEGSALEERLSTIVRGAADRSPIVRYWWNVVLTLRAAHAHGDPWTGLQRGNALREVFEEIGGDEVSLSGHLFRGLNLIYLGGFDAAERDLDAISVADESMGIVGSLRRFAMAYIYSRRGQFDEALALATRLAEVGRARGIRVDEARGRWAQGEVLRRRGDLERAERELTAAVELAVPLERPGILGTLALLRLAQNRAAEGLATAEDAMARIAAMGGCGMFRGAYVRLAHAEALRATGAHDAARRAIGEARDRVLATAAKIAAPSYRQSFLEQVPENARTLALAAELLGPPPTPATE
jgi:tetratricopeptide (TPR) repeat protein